MKNKRLGTCPECGSNTVVEKENISLHGFNPVYVRVERCDGLIEKGEDKPLEACMWSQDLDDYYEKTNHHAGVTGVGIMKP